jgi:hypothetical protein
MKPVEKNTFQVLVEATVIKIIEVNACSYNDAEDIAIDRFYKTPLTKEDVTVQTSTVIDYAQTPL